MYLLVKIHIRAFIKWSGILLFFFPVFTSHVFPQDDNFRNFSSEDGLTQPYVYVIIQDVHGYLWVGTGNGLSRYNGFIFENYTTSDSLADNFIACGISDGECLWFGHMNGLISYYNGKNFQAVDIPQENTSPITHFVKSPDGKIWVSTYSDGIMKLEQGTGVVKHYLFKDPILVTSFDFLDHSELIIGTNSGLLYGRINESDEIEIIRPVAEIPKTKVTCIQKMRNKPGFYVATEYDGIFKLNHEDNLFKVSIINANLDFDITGIQHVCEDSQSNLWMGSFGNGLIKLIYSASGELTKINNYNNANGFATDNVKTVFEDREGNIWSGNYGEGLTQITPKTFHIYSFDNSSYGNNIFSVCFDQQNMWIGTENGLAKMDRPTGKIIKFYSRGSGLPKDTVTTIYFNDGKELWIGTEKNGLYLMDIENEKILKYQIGNGTLENSITSITGKGEQVWVGTKKGLCCINTGTNSINWYSINQGGLPHNFINCLYIDKMDRLWVSTRSNTLVYIQDENVNKISINSVSGILTLGPITEDTNSRIWVGSNGNGVFVMDSDSIINLTAKEGLLSDYCYSLICDGHKNIWVGHKGGLSRIRTSDFSVKPIQHINGTMYNYQFNSNAITTDQQEKVWFGSDKGIISHDPSMDYARYLPPVLGVTSIRVNDEEIDCADKLILSPGNYKIRIDFLGISMKEPELVTYQYILEGYDQWSEITRNTSITYNHLTEGEYKFILNSASGDGAVSEDPLTLSIIIKKPIWKKWWFYFILTFLLIILTFSYIKRREYRLLAEKKILEEKVRERTYEIQSQKNEIELQRDMIDKKNKNITSSISYASNIQSAVLPPKEYIDKLLPDNFILSRPKDIVSGDFYWLAERDHKIVFTVADCTGHGVPGAFMSLLGITLLNEIVNIGGITRSDDIITKLRERVVHSLHQDDKDLSTADGIDLALCVLDQKQQRIQYSGGMNDLVYIRNGKLEIVEADRVSVSALSDDTSPYTMKEIAYKKGDVCYLFTDGYPDQFGGDRNKKYLVCRFHSILLKIHALPMIRQKEILENELHEWMNDTIQTDDITVMGVRL